MLAALIAHSFCRVTASSCSSPCRSSTTTISGNTAAKRLPQMQSMITQTCRNAASTAAS
jgi:hypothetical protein